MEFEDAYEELLGIGRRYHFSPDVPYEAEEFWREQIASYTGTPEELAQWAEEQAIQSYRAISQRPNWIQDPEWPLDEGEPMLFVGQIDISRKPPWIRGDASFYVFWNPKTGGRKMVIQSS